jgi:hypothetical protein
MADFNSSLPIRTETAGDVIAKIADATTPGQQLAVDASGRIITRIQASDGDAITSTVAGATNPIDAILRDAAGVVFGTATNPIAVAQTVNGVGDEINDYKVAAAIAGGATDNHDYTVTAAKTLLLTQIEGSASGKAKMEVQVETGVATDVWTTHFVKFNSTSTPNMELELKAPIAVAAGVRVRVIMTNRDNQAQDLYSTISGQEV